MKIYNLLSNLIVQITSTGDKSYLRLQSPRLEGALTGTLHDAAVPFPKTYNYYIYL